MQLNEYRCCIVPLDENPYSVSGHYIVAHNDVDAYMIMRQRYPSSNRIHVELWKENLDPNFWQLSK